MRTGTISTRSTNMNKLNTVSAILVTACAVTVQADWTLDWHTIDGGGGRSAGGAFELTGTIGQPDASTPLAGGPYQLTGGFWVSDAAASTAGDMNCDGVVTFQDINPFVLYLSNLGAWQVLHPGCPPANGDINGDGQFPSFGDINPFVALLSAP
jgi:hypothetical protein